MRKSFIIIVVCFFFQNLLAQNIPHSNFSAPWGIQVNTFNGNLYLKRTDLVIPNQGLSINLSFAYNSFRDTLDIGFGKGWTSSYSLHYENIGTDTMVVEMADGRKDLFIKNNGQYLAPTGIFDLWEEYNSGKFRLTTKYGMKYFFDEFSHQRITKIEDANGNQINLNYSGGELTTITDNSNRSVNLSWNNGHLTTITDANFTSDRMIQFSYNNDLLTQVTDPLNNNIVYGYNDFNSLNYLLNEKGDEMQIQFNESEKVSSITTCLAHIAFSYNPDLSKTYVTENNEAGNRSTTYTYDEAGKLTQKTGNCCGYNTQYQYDDDNNINIVTDANGNNITASHDNIGNPLFMTDAEGGNQYFSFESTFNRLQNLTDKRGNSNYFEYDSNGNLEKITQAEGIETEFSYDNTGNITATTDGNNQTTTITYNGNNDITSIQYPIGNESFVYDGVGNMKNIIDANGNAVSYLYNALNNLVSVTDDLNNSIVYDYDPSSNLTKETDSNGNDKTYSYDAHHRLESVTTPSGYTVYNYDASDNLTSITDANAHTSTFEYNQRDLLIAENDPLNNRTSYNYDGNGNILNRTDANGMTNDYTYDKLNRLLSKNYSGNTDNYSYDINGNLLQCSNNHISMSFTYDALNRVTSKSIINWNITIYYEYDYVGNRTKMTDPSGITRYEYDANNRLTKITNPFAEETIFEYDNGGRLTRQNNDNGTYSEYAYDAANHLLSLENKSSNNNVLSSYTYSYDNNGNRLSMTTHEGGIAVYTYDDDNRLMTVNYINIAAVNENYQIDSAGNRTSLNGTNYTYDTADRLQSAGNITYDFDANGNLILKTENGEITRYHYDGENRLLHVELSNGNDIQYKYDPFGNRISQTNENITTRYLLDGDNVLMELDDSGNTLARYTSGLALDSWISMKRNGESFFYHTDGLGSTTTLTNHAQSIDAEYQYDAYGNILSQSGNVSNPYTYTGREFDDAIGLYYYRTRFYDAKVGRFLTKDGFPSIQILPETQNRYTYVNNNPLKYTDPQGEFFFIPLLIPLAKIGVASFLGSAALGTVTSIIDQIGDLESINGKIDCGKAIIDGIDDGISDFWDPSKKIEKGKKLIKKGLQLIFKKNYKKGIKKSIKGGKKYIEGSAKAGAYDYAKDRLSESFSFNCNPFSDGDQEKEKGTPPPPPTLPELPLPDDGRTICIPIIRSSDPNEIIAPNGCDVQNWVAQSATLPYTILYENDPNFATAPAQKVIVEHIFDSEINPFSFRLGDFGFGDYYFEVPDDVSFYTTQIDLIDSLGILLDVTAGLDIANNKAFWFFESKDPLTGLISTLPADVGYLPVNDSLTHVGEGFVNFTVSPKISAVTWDTIHAKADIIFDDNPPILTNLAFNLIDADIPASQIQTVETLADNQFHIMWEGTDIGSGIVGYILYVSTNNDLFLPVSDNLTDTEYTFTGEEGNTYQFSVIAIDCAGNIEPISANGCALVLSNSIVTQPNQGETNGSISLSILGSAGELTYEWSPFVSTDSIATGLSQGTYFIDVTDEIGCSLSLEIELETIVGIEEIFLQNELFINRLYPIPAHSILNIEFYSSSKNVWLEVLNIHGKKMISRTLQTNSTTVNKEALNIQSWPTGTYLVSIRTKEEVVNGLFLKQ